MPSNYEKLERPTGPSIDTLTIPEKTAISHVTPLDVPSNGISTASTPCSDRLNPFDTDIERMVTSKSTGDCSRIAPAVSKSECQVWPGKQDWKQKAKLAKKQRGCTCMAGLSRRNKLIAKILIVFLVVGVAVGVGFGISKPLGAHIWGDNKSN